MACRFLAGALICSGLTTVAPADVEPHAGMLRYPDVGTDRIVFVYADDLWVVDRDGGQAVPLASPPGAEQFPKFSADGRSIAFMGNYDGNRDLYVVPVQGGLPQRVTHHPTTEVLCDWTPDGELLYYGFGIEGMPRGQQLFTVDATGGFPKMLPVPYGAAGAISPDGTWLAYTPHTRDTRTWKRYRGGMATDIWLFNLKTHESQRITEWEGTDTLPMWHGKTLYYLSDDGGTGRLNIWSFDPRTGRREQVTQFTDKDVKWPSLGPGDSGQGEIVFQSGTELYLLDLDTEKTRSVKVTIPGARPTIRTKVVDASDFTEWWHISSTGKRAVVEARGDIWTLPAEKGSPRNLTRTSHAAERQASWSPDGRWIAYFSDATGEYELYIIQSDGKGEPRRLTSGHATWFTDPVWSPDSERIVFTDKASNFYLHTIESGETEIIDRDPWAPASRPSWSHDSRWLAYSRSGDDTPVTSIWLYELETGERTQVTSGMFPDGAPSFDRKGDYLYFASSRSFNPTYSDLDTTFVYNQSQVLMAVPLREDVEAPWLPESDEEEWSEEEEDGDEEETEADESGDDEDAEEGEDDAEDEGKPEDDGVSGTYEGTLSGGEMPPGMEFSMTLTLNPDGTVTGSVSVPMGSGEVEGTYDKATGRISGTVTTEEGEVMDMSGTITGGKLELEVSMGGMTIELTGTRTVVGVDSENGENGKDSEAREVVEIETEDFEERAIMLPVPAANFGGLAVNHKNQLIYARMKPNSVPEIMLFDITDDKKAEKSVAKGAGGFEISADGKKLILLRGNGASIQDASAGATAKNVVTSGMMMHVEPREEWKQLVNEAWRLERDFFYVDNMHGVDWEAMRERYLAMLDDCASRRDVSYVIRELIAELNIGHAYYREGDVGDEPNIAVGLLGVDWELDADNAAYRIKRIIEGAAWDVDARNPLRATGIDVNEGDYVLAVNGVPLDPDADPWAAFIGTAGRAVTLTVNTEPVFDENARDVVIKPLASDRNLRYRAWIERNRQYVADQTDGQVGYVYVPNTGVDGQNDLFRQAVGQMSRDALIIDERWNGGGQIPSRFIEMLNRPVTNYWARRDHKDWKWPPDSHSGPKCMLINGLAGSGGDLFPWFFKEAGLGKLVGTRTWGGLVGISGNPGLIDGAGVTVPTFGFYETDGTWGVEGHGVDADIVVLDDPALMVDGGDPQLDAAIALMLEEIDRNPYVPPLTPSPPDRSGMGITEADK